MNRQLVKKSRTDKRKRKGYKGWDTAKNWGTKIGTTGGGILAFDVLFNLLKAAGGGKDGGRVTKRGIGKAKRGLGKVMRKK